MTRILTTATCVVLFLPGILVVALVFLVALMFGFGQASGEAGLTSR